jgi:hypothetical protein
VLQAAQALGQRGEGMGSVKKSDSSVRNLAMLVEVPSLGGKFDDTSASKLVLSRFANSKEGGKTEKVAWVDLEPANPFSKARVDEGYKQWMPQSNGMKFKGKPGVLSCTQNGQGSLVHSKEQRFRAVKTSIFLIRYTCNTEKETLSGKQRFSYGVPIQYGLPLSSTHPTPYERSSFDSNYWYNHPNGVMPLHHGMYGYHHHVHNNYYISSPYGMGFCQHMVGARCVDHLGFYPSNYAYSHDWNMA